MTANLVQVVGTLSHTREEPGSKFENLLQAGGVLAAGGPVPRAWVCPIIILLSEGVCPIVILLSEGVW